MFFYSAFLPVYNVADESLHFAAMKTARWIISFLVLVVVCSCGQQSNVKDSRIYSVDTLGDTVVKNKMVLKDSFKLFNPLDDSAKTDFHSNHSSMLHHYLCRYYESDSINILRYDHSDSVMCEFKQYFEFDISFYSNLCGESGGKDELTIPKTTKHEVIQLLENVLDVDYEISSWNSDSTSMYTDGVGCLVELEDRKEFWFISVVCTC